MKEDPQQSQYISETWSYKWSAVLAAQKEGLNWLFILNIGGVAGSLAYASAKESTFFVIFALIAFSGGLLALMFFALRYYYYEESMFFSFKNDVQEFRSNQIEWSELIERENNRPVKYKACEKAVWFSVALAFAGVVSSAIAII